MLMKEQPANCRSLTLQRQVMKQDNTWKTTTQVRLEKQIQVDIIINAVHSLSVPTSIPQIPVPTESTTTTPYDEDCHHEDY